MKSSKKYMPFFNHTKKTCMLFHKIVLDTFKHNKPKHDKYNYIFFLFINVYNKKKKLPGIRNNRSHTASL